MVYLMDGVVEIETLPEERLGKGMGGYKCVFPTFSSLLSLLFLFRKAFTQIPRDATFNFVSLILPPPTVYKNVKLYFTCLKLVEE